LRGGKRPALNRRSRLKPAGTFAGDIAASPLQGALSVERGAFTPARSNAVAWALGLTNAASPRFTVSGGAGDGVPAALVGGHVRLDGDIPGTAGGGSVT
jgi:hypothetical protein